MSTRIWLLCQGNPRIPRSVLGVVVALATLGLAVGHWASTTEHPAPGRTPHVQRLAYRNSG